MRPAGIGGGYDAPIMTLIAVSIAVHSASQIDTAIERAAAAVSTGAKLIEWRIDELAEDPDALTAAVKLVQRSPAPCIVTCRPQWEGGDYEGEERSRLELLASLAAGEHRPRYIDIELKSLQRENIWAKNRPPLGDVGEARDLHTSLIVSAHDFQGRPPDLLQRIESMVNEPACAVIKVAWHARSLRDNLEAFELLAARRKPMIALCMGRFGLMSRVLAPKFGGFLTFASDSPTEVTAPGQPMVEELISLYRFDRINPKTKVYGVIGWPVEHSLSPAIHNAGFEAVGHDGVYLPLPIPGGAAEYEHFKATVGALIDAPVLDFRGASVTIPHKENLLRFVRERGGRSDALTERIGAANTLIVGSAGGLECANTDCPAAMQALTTGMGIDQKGLAGTKIAVIGAGGVARAIVIGLVDAGALVTVFNRNQERARRLIEDATARNDAGGQAPSVSIGSFDSMARSGFEVFINCTPIGMTGGPAPYVSPLPADVRLDENVTVFDTVYTPARTPLIAEAEARGARVISGIEMFVRQAAMQFERWTGTAAPMQVIKNALRRT